MNNTMEIIPIMAHEPALMEEPTLFAMKHLNHIREMYFNSSTNIDENINDFERTLHQITVKSQQKENIPLQRRNETHTSKLMRQIFTGAGDTKTPLLTNSEITIKSNNQLITYLKSNESTLNHTLKLIRILKATVHTPELEELRIQNKTHVLSPEGSSRKIELEFSTNRIEITIRCKINRYDAEDDTVDLNPLQTITKIQISSKGSISTLSTSFSVLN